MAEILKRNGWAIEKSKISYHLVKVSKSKISDFKFLFSLQKLSSMYVFVIGVMPSTIGTKEDKDGCVIPKAKVWTSFIFL
jgi:hypothetical protein